MQSGQDSAGTENNLLQRPNRSTCLRTRDWTGRVCGDRAGTSGGPYFGVLAEPEPPPKKILGKSLYHEKFLPLVESLNAVMRRVAARD
jgi:hypothetical protein